MNIDLTTDGCFFFMEYVCDKLHKKGYQPIYGLCENWDYSDDHIILLNPHYYIAIRIHPNADPLFQICTLNNRYMIPLNRYAMHTTNHDPLEHDQVCRRMSKYISENPPTQTDNIIYETRLHNMMSHQRLITILETVAKFAPLC